MENSISVIIPTIQKRTKVLNKLLELLNQDKSVDEILIINNLTNVPIHYNNDKVKVYTPLKNLYVNQSWNIGVSLIKNENFCLMNDDMICVPDFCSMVVNSEVFNAADTGFIGINPMFINQHYNIDSIEVPEKNENAHIEFSVLNKYLKTGDWGISIFSRRHNWHVIPGELKIIYGDNYLLYKSLQQNKKNYQISNIFINHIHSSSSASPEFSEIVRSDIANSYKYIP